MSLTGYDRGNGRWGFRNHVLILPLHQILSSSAREIEAKSEGAVAVSHDWSQVIEKDHERIIHSLAGNATNPNLYATVLLRLGTPIEDEVITRAKKYGNTKLIEVSLTEAKSIENLTQAGIQRANELLKEAKAQQRVSAPISAIVLGLECGGSDAYSGITANPALGVASDELVAQGATSILGETMEILGAEHLLAQRAITKEVGQQIIDVVARYEASINYEGIDIRGAQPSRGNIEGGLSTLEEKSLGAAKKADKTKKPKNPKQVRTTVVPKKAVVGSSPARVSQGTSLGLGKHVDELNLKSSVAMIVDQQTLQVLFEKNPQSVLPIASITKLLTAMTVLDAQLPLDEILEINAEDAAIYRNSRLAKGADLSRREALLLALQDEFSIQNENT